MKLTEKRHGIFFEPPMSYERLSFWYRGRLAANGELRIIWCGERFSLLVREGVVQAPWLFKEMWLGELADWIDDCPEGHKVVLTVPGERATAENLYRELWKQSGFDEKEPVQK